MSIKDIAQSIIKSINDGDTLTTVSLGAQNFHSDSVKIASVLLIVVFVLVASQSVDTWKEQ